MKFFVWLNDQQQGPLDEETIRQMVSDGQIARDTLVCQEAGDLDWTSVGELFFNDTKLKSLGLAEIHEQTDLTGQVDNGSRLEIRLISGAKLIVKAVRLYDEIALAELNSKKHQAMEMLKGVSTGLGAIGSIGWVLAASAIIGAAEAVMSAGVSSAGSRLLEEVLQADKKLRNEGVFFTIGKIQHIENPLPGFWRVPNTGELETQTIRSAFVHNGDEFISVLVDDDSVYSIRWNAVESYVRLKTKT